MTTYGHFARAIVRAFPDRVLWGWNWPASNMVTHMPDDGVLTDMIVPKFAPTAAAAPGKLLLVDNPTRLYWSN